MTTTACFTSRRLIPVLTLALALLAPCALAQPVSPADLRREIERLQSENQRLATQAQAAEEQAREALARAEAAEVRAAELARTVERLEARLAGLGGPIERVPQQPTSEGAPSEPTAEPAKIPADPMASPSSLLLELQRRFEADIATDVADPAHPLTTADRRTLTDWCERQARELRGSIDWRVRLWDLRPLGRNDRSAMLVVLDPETDQPIGEPLEVLVPRAPADRLARALERADQSNQAPPIWTLRGAIAAAPHVNPDRPTEGVFNHPLLVGRFVEFGFELRWNALGEAAPLELPQSTSQNPSTTTASPGSNPRG
ncbi:MAG: hypothetical protein H6809_02040 [Phycisphaeraceae bacterium]|nr:hypothetical protein [Phycisphaeraceae bacterium]